MVNKKIFTLFYTAISSFVLVVLVLLHTPLFLWHKVHISALIPLATVSIILLSSLSHASLTKLSLVATDHLTTDLAISVT